MCPLSSLPSVLRMVSLFSSCLSSPQNLILLNNVGDMQNRSIMNAHLHWLLRMSLKMLERLLLQSLLNAFKSECTGYFISPHQSALTQILSLDSEIDHSTMKIVTIRVSMGVKQLGQVTSTEVTMHFHLMQPGR